MAASLTIEDVDRVANVCVIGTELMEKFFDRGDPIGQTLKIGGVPMTVIGVEAKRGVFMGDSMDNNAYIPVDDLRQAFWSAKEFANSRESSQSGSISADDRRSANAHARQT